MNKVALVWWGILGYVAFFALTLAIMVVEIVWASKAHASDLVLGDSIALGTGHALGKPTVARKGAGSCEIAGWLPARGGYGRVVISAGINDDGACVATLRSRLRARRVIWILPAPINGGRAAVLKAIHVGDGSLSYRCAGPCTKSNFHPGSYAKVAADVRKQW